MLRLPESTGLPFSLRFRTPYPFRFLLRFWSLHSLCSWIIVPPRPFATQSCLVRSRGPSRSSVPRLTVAFIFMFSPTSFERRFMSFLRSRRPVVGARRPRRSLRPAPLSRRPDPGRSPGPDMGGFSKPGLRAARGPIIPCHGANR